MGLLDDAIRDHLELKRRHGAADDEVTRLEEEAFGPGRLPAPAPEPEPEAEPIEPAAESVPRGPTVPEPDEDPDLPRREYEPEPAVAPPSEAPPLPPTSPAPESIRVRPEPEPWLDEPDEVPAEDALEPVANGAAEDVLEATPEFLQETPDHDRLWFEQKPPRGFDFDG